MAGRLTVHAADTPTRSWLEVDGERVQGVRSVRLTEMDGEPVGLELLVDHRVLVVDRRAGAAETTEGG